MSIITFKNKINSYSSKGIPFIFLIDFELVKPIVFTLDEAKENGLLYDVKSNSNYNYPNTKAKIKSFKITPINKKEYYIAFDKVRANINQGNSYLLNLTFPSIIESTHSLIDFFNISSAPYKLLYKNDFTVFSPECFVKIIDNHIYSYPMKGTIDASIPNAENIILNDKKELYEHNTIVDLIRNDMSIISKKVKVTRFRYLDRIKTNNKELLQVSSEIKGELPENWRENLGDILLKLLPAGSISGAPKRKTIDIIKDAENRTRGYYTGIFGIFDGCNLDSAVNIRFIEKTKQGLLYRSGGGITALSDKESEYKELINKIYVPTS